MRTHSYKHPPLVLPHPLTHISRARVSPMTSVRPSPPQRPRRWRCAYKNSALARGFILLPTAMDNVPAQKRKKNRRSESSRLRRNARSRRLRNRPVEVSQTPPLYSPLVRPPLPPSPSPHSPIPIESTPRPAQLRRYRRRRPRVPTCSEQLAAMNPETLRRGIRQVVKCWTIEALRQMVVGRSKDHPTR